ncbi:hypothetical protein V6N13_125459 [Hibiscus sabdariffa]
MTSAPKGPKPPPTLTSRPSTPSAPIGQPELQYAPCWACTMPSDLAHPLVLKSFHNRYGKRITKSMLIFFISFHIPCNLVFKEYNENDYVDGKLDQTDLMVEYLKLCENYLVPRRMIQSHVHKMLGD